MKQLLIRDIRIDFQRCQVQRGDEVLSLEPKVAQVLLHLAQHPGEVVSHQALLEAVWGKAIVDPSSLQRCIGQLRKALGDNARTQHSIATYPKIGYSLTAPVNWLDAEKSPQPAAPRRWQHYQQKAPGLILALSLVIMAMLLATILMKEQELLPARKDASTDTDVKLLPQSLPAADTDFYAIYSPDGHAIVYPRRNEQGLMQLWVRELSEEKEWPVEAPAEHLHSPAWSPDGQQLAVVGLQCKAAACTDAAQCQGLFLIATTAGDHRLLFCQNHPLHSPQWLTQNDIAFIAENDTGSRVLSLSLDNEQLEPLLEEPGLTPHHLAFSASLQRLAVSGRRDNGRQEIHLINLHSGHTNILRPELPALPGTLAWQPLWASHAPVLLIQHDEAVYEIALDGTVRRDTGELLPEGSYPRP